MAARLMPREVNELPHILHDVELDILTDEDVEGIRQTIFLDICESYDYYDYYY